MRLCNAWRSGCLTAAVLITEMESIESIEIDSSADLTDKKFEIRNGDILANLPYHPNCSKWFDHHS